MEKRDDKIKLLGAAAVALTTALAGPAMAQQTMSGSGRCSSAHPSADCRNQNMASHNSYGSYGHTYQRPVAYRNGNNRNGNYDNRNYGWNDSGWNSDGWNNGGWHQADSGFWPGDVAAGVVNGAVGTASAVVGAAGAIATAPFRGDSYAYYNGGNDGGNSSWDNGWNDSWNDNGWNNNGWNGAYRQTYAQRNGFVCQPGTWFKGSDGRPHICQ